MPRNFDADDWYKLYRQAGGCMASGFNDEADLEAEAEMAETNRLIATMSAEHRQRVADAFNAFDRACFIASHYG